MAYFSKQTFRITKVIDTDGNIAELQDNRGKIPLTEGTLLGVNELILTNNSHVEVRDHTGLIFRLGKNST